jgi:uncharacterized protein
MNDELFDWDDANIHHIAAHDVVPEEAEEVVLGDPLEMGFEKTVAGEDRWSYVGETSRGTVLQVVITLRGEKIRVISAFEPTKRDKLFYLAYKAEQQ